MTNWLPLDASRHIFDMWATIRVLFSSYNIVQDPLGFIHVLDMLAKSSPLLVSVYLLAAFIGTSYILGLLTKNYSWVDRLWSITPPLYSLVFVWHMATYKPYNSEGFYRLVIIAALVCIWGARLTYNFARKGGYSLSSEDYRWRTVLGWFGNAHGLWVLPWELFHLGFICVYQHVLIWSLVAPSFLVWAAVDQPSIDLWDLAIASAFLALLGIETMADQQQWRFQQVKHAPRASTSVSAELKSDLKRGFLTSGLFRYSRHPNFFAEQSMWLVLYLFGVRVSGMWLNATLAGPVLLVLLFQGSTWLTELLSCKKYPEYKQYQKTTSQLIPLPPSAPMPELKIDVKKSK